MIVQAPPLQLPEDSLMLSWSLYDRHRFIGLLLKTAREKAGLEQAEASAAAGLSQSTASNIERLAHFRGDDRRRPSRDVILRLARGAYGLDESFVKAIVWAYDKRALTAAERRVYFSQMDACDYEEPQHVQAAYVVGAIEDYILPHLRKRLPEIELDAPLSFERDVA
ncbi:MAG: helix-turn-helix transcriptional regulator, partial [Chloroflexi bacterium]|nr:helix-turn-helix transcriptional regulator [Chloroflexota bacterium]